MTGCRRPDGLLLSGSRETAIEVDRTAKSLDQHLAILDAYADHGVASHWYVVSPAAQEHILHAAEVLDVLLALVQHVTRRQPASNAPGHRP